MTFPNLIKRLSIGSRGNNASPVATSVQYVPENQQAHPAHIPNGNGSEKPRSPAEQAKGLLQSQASVEGKSPHADTKRNTRKRGHGIDFQGLAGATAIINTKPKPSKADDVLAEIEDHVQTAQNAQGTATAMLAGVKTTLDMTGGAEAIEHTFDTFLEGSKVLMGALDAVSKIHPFVGVVVVAFQAAWKLEMARRESDKKIVALFSEMNDMMGVLVRLENVRDPKVTSRNGMTVEDGMQDLVQSAAIDIEKCANTCEMYQEKKLIVKVLNGPFWERRLTSYVAVFEKHRSNFEFALSLHTAVTADATNRTLGDVQSTTTAIDKKMNKVMEMFEKLMSAEERELADIVNQKGGTKAVQEDENLLEELNKRKLQKSSSKIKNGPDTASEPYGLEDLQKDLHADTDEAIQKNLELFSRKFDLLKDRIVEEMGALVHREGDRIVDALTAGSHDKIVDNDIYLLWKEMGWKGSVKTRYFIMALRDYFCEKWGSDVKAAEENTAPLASAVGNSEEWALAYLSIRRLQPISESFDDDASGFVTVAEANAFTKARPLHWSLPHWIAFWAIGWHQSLAFYAQKIRDMFAKMFAIIPNILPANRGAVNKYISEVYRNVRTIEAAVNPCYINEALQDKFRDYLDKEEARLKKGLKKVRYAIDQPETLTLITGPGRIGKFGHMVLYLLLERHFEIFRIGQRHVLHQDELPNAAGAIEYVIVAFKDRFEHLKSIFKQQRLDLRQQFSTFAHGMFQYLYDPAGLWAPDIVKKTEFPDYPYDETMEGQNIKVEDILNFPADQPDLDFAAYDPPSPTDESNVSLVNAAFAPVLGPWNGYTYRKVFPAFPNRGMISITLHPSSMQGQTSHFQASNPGHFTITGKCVPGEDLNTIEISMKRKFSHRMPTQYWAGQLDVDMETITGTWGDDPDSDTHRNTFILKRTKPEILRFRPSLATIEVDKARALWSFALSAVLSEIRRQSWCWEYFKERRDTRNRFLGLYPRLRHFGHPLGGDELKAFRRVRQELTAADSRFYHSLANSQIRRTTIHNLRCANCNGSIGGARIICLVCQAKNTWDTLDLCESPGCLTASVKRDNLPRPHVPTHAVIKVRRVVHIRQFGKLEREAKQALERAKAILNIDETQDLDRYDTEDSPTELDPVFSSHIIDLASKRTSSSFEPKCVGGCNKKVTLPCWYYVHRVNSFICDGCEARLSAEESERIARGVWYYSRDPSQNKKPRLDSGDAQDRDNEAHDLVRCQPIVPEAELVVSVENRLANLEENYATVDRTLRGLDSKIDALLRTVLGKCKETPES